jgi:acetylglutamate kinase
VGRVDIKDLSISIDSLHYIKRYSGKTFVIKYGGSIMKNEEAQKAFLEDVLRLKNMGVNLVIVHGGGPEINKWLERSGIESNFVNGLRVTDRATMEIVEMVLSGHVNKRIAANLSKNGINAIGVSGRDSNLIRAKRKYLYEDDEVIDIGYVGEVSSINRNFLEDLLDKDYIPVISPVGCDSKGNVYNINADYAASFISSVLNSEKLIIMTDVEGVYKDINDSTSLISSITIEEIKDYIDCGIITKGMIPKMECCIDAIEHGTKNVHLIDGRKEHSLLLDVLTGCGTKIIGKEGVEECQKVI